MEKIDLLIIGAGPAGVSTALHLLQEDPSWAGRMLVLEKTAHPRHKLCGGGVTRFGLDLLQGLGFPRPLPIPHVAVEDARLAFRSRVVHVRARPEFVVYQRAELDAYLAGQARERGVRIVENAPAQALLWDTHGVTVKTPLTTFLARAVVGADGSKGLTRQLVRDGSRPRVARLLEVVHPAPANAPQFNQNYALFDFTPAGDDLQGYVWDFPSRVHGRPHHNRGVYDARLASSRPRAGLPALLRQAIHHWSGGETMPAVEGHPIHWFSPRNWVALPRLLLVGDTAGADPLFGEGIAPALGYGQVAARVIERGFQHSDLSFRDYRLRLLASPVGRYLLLRWAAAHWIYRFSRYERFMDLVWTLGKGLAWTYNRSQAK